MGWKGLSVGRGGEERVSCMLHHCAASGALSTAVFLFTTELQGQVCEQHVCAHLFYIRCVCFISEREGTSVINPRHVQ